MTTDDFISALNIAVERGDLTSNQKVIFRKIYLAMKELILY